MKWIFRHKLVASIILSTIYTVFILPITESLWFSQEISDSKSIVYRAILRAVFGLAMTCLIWFALNFTQKLVTKDKFYKSWLIHAGAFGAFLFAVLILIWPGYWVWDEFWVLSGSYNYSVHAWQHIFTQVQYILSLYIIPSSTGITIIQIIAIAIIVGYLLARARQLFKHRWFAYLLLIPLLSFPALLSDFYTLRLNIYAYLLLIYLLNIYLFFVGKLSYKNSFLTFMGFVALATILGFWRSEGVVYLIPLLPIALRLWPLKVLASKGLREIIKLLGVTALSLLIIATGYTVTKATELPYYQLTATINPLSMMIHDNLSGKDIDKSWQNIATVLDLDVLKQYPSYTETPSMWQSNNRAVVKEDYEHHLNEYYDGVKYIFLNNLPLFLKYKFLTFGVTAGFITDDASQYRSWAGFLTTYSLSGCDTMDEQHCRLLTEFDVNSKANMPLNPELREKILSVLLQQNLGESHQKLSRNIIWNIIPVIVLLVTTGIHSLINRRWLWSSIFLLLLTHAGLVFIAAPATYFMYYFPIYLAGSIFVIIYILMNIESRLTKTGKVRGKK